MNINILDIINQYLQSQNNKIDIDTISLYKYREYGKAVVENRVLPSIYDGLKPVQRRVLYTMYKLKALPNKAPLKSAKIVGDAMGNYHPHGDSSIYNALSSMIQEWKNNIPLLSGQGNFGSIDGDNPAAMRYTEARLSPNGYEICFKDFENSTVSFKANYDDTKIEPINLPTQLPLVLLNGIDGIGVGFATKIAPHNIREILNTLILTYQKHQIKKSISNEDICKIITAPDFPTGGIIHDIDMKKIITTGKGGFKIRAKCEIFKRNNYYFIKISEIPYGVLKSNILNDIANYTKNSNNIISIQDLSNKDGLEIQLKLNNNINPQQVLDYLYKNTSLEISFKYNMVVIDNKDIDNIKIIETDFQTIFNKFAEFKREIILNKYINISEQNKQKLRYIEITLKTIDNIEQVVKIIKNNSKQEAKIKLTQLLSITKEEAEYILEIKLYRISNISKQEILKEKNKVEKIINNAEAIIKSDRRKFTILINEAKALLDLFKDYKRKSSMINIDKRLQEKEQNKKCRIVVTKNNYIYKTYNTENSEINKKIDNDNKVIQDIITNNNSKILVICNDGIVYPVNIHNIQEEQLIYIDNIFNIKYNQKVISIIVVDSKNDFNKNIIMVTSKGYIKRTNVIDFINAKKVNAGIIGIKLKDEQVVYSALSNKNEKNQILLISSNGKAIKFDINDINIIGRNTRGVKGITLEEDCQVVSAIKIDNILTKMYINVYTEKKQKPKRVEIIKSIKKQNRSGKGVYIFKVTSKTGKIKYIKID